jgi:hypothetical protein
VIGLLQEESEVNNGDNSGFPPVGREPAAAEAEVEGPVRLSAAMVAAIGILQDESEAIDDGPMSFVQPASFTSRNSVPSGALPRTFNAFKACLDMPTAFRCCTRTCDLPVVGWSACTQTSWLCA